MWATLCDIDGFQEGIWVGAGRKCHCCYDSLLGIQDSNWFWTHCWCVQWTCIHLLQTPTSTLRPQRSTTTNVLNPESDSPEPPVTNDPLSSLHINPPRDTAGGFYSFSISTAANCRPWRERHQDTKFQAQVWPRHRAIQQLLILQLGLAKVLLWSVSIMREGSSTQGSLLIYSVSLLSINYLWWFLLAFLFHT